MVIVGVTGYKGSGKDTVAAVFSNQFSFSRYEFARPMKRACAVIFDWGNKELYGSLKEKIDPRWGISPRQALQHIGTEWGQLALCEAFPLFDELTGRGLWVRLFIEEMARHSAVERWIVSDVRFLHEVSRLKEIGAIIIKVIRPRINRGGDSHESENHYDEILADIEIMNDGSLMDLRRKAYKVASEILSVPH